MSLSEVPKLTDIRAQANKAIGLRDAVERQVAENERQIKELENEEELLELVASLIRQLIDAEVTDGVKAVEKLQSEGLAEVFYDQNLAVRAEVEESRGKVSVTLLTTTELKNGAVVEGVADQSFGGSVLTMQSILMRITVIFRRGLRPLLLLDETLVAVADQYIDRATKFLYTLSKRLGIDILLITHDDAIVSAAHRAYFVTKTKDKAQFREVSVADLRKART